MKPERIPIFPLETVLFPGAPLPLHIFEDRYKLMIRRCRESSLEFGVVLARENGIAPVGCTAAIEKVLKEYPDGKLDILTVGRDVCRVLEVYQDEPYLEAKVSYVSSPPERAVGPDEQESLLHIFNQCHKLIYGQELESIEAEEVESLAFTVANELPLDLEYKQSLLETPLESDRQLSLAARLEKWLPQLTHIHNVKRASGGNGHGLKQ